MSTQSGDPRPRRLLLATLGSRGDVDPFLHLARAAHAAGYTVRLAIPGDADPGTDGPEIVDLGVRFADLTPDGSTSPARAFREKIRPGMSRALATFVEAGVDWEPDVIVAHPKVLTAPVLAEHLGIPHLAVELTPTLTPTAEFPAAGIASSSKGALLNRLSYRVLDLAGAMFASDVSAARRRLGVTTRRPQAPDATLVAISPSLLPRPADWPPTALITGDWHEQDTVREVDPEVDAFTRDNIPFIYAGFGSMTGGDPVARAEAIIEGARKAGVRVIMATGWGGLELPARTGGRDLLIRETVPHNTVLPRAIAAIHHGGAGTAHAVARSGIPSIVVPFLGDQPFWARQLNRIGLAPAALHRNKLTGDRVKTAIAAAMDCAAQARVVAEAMRTEDGTGRALEIISEHAGREIR